MSMGIYIPGIEMTKGHNYVTITIWPSGTASYGLFDREENLCDFKSIKAVPVPPHGDLISRSALIADLMDRGIEGIQTDDWHEIQQAIMDAPAIIPADEVV